MVSTKSNVTSIEMGSLNLCSIFELNGSRLSANEDNPMIRKIVWDGVSDRNFKQRAFFARFGLRGTCREQRTDRCSEIAFGPRK